MPGPLAGLKVLDFTTLLPGPFATMMIADMGADVIRIASGSRPDLVAIHPPFIAETGLSTNLAYLCRGKRSIALNLKNESAVNIARKLIERSDVLVEQFRPGVMASFGLDYENASRINPSLVYCSLTGYGQKGPLSERAGHDINYLALSGLMGYSGRVAEGPALTGMQIADLAGGSLHAVVGILAAVIARSSTGKGQHVDVAMLDGVMACNGLVGSAILAGGRNPGREDTLLNGGSLYDFYETKDGGHISVGSLEPKFFSAFCEGIGRPDLAEGGIHPPNVQEVKEEVRRIVKSKTLREWEETFSKRDACVEPVLSLKEALNRPHVRERECVVEVPLPKGGTVRQLATPIKFSQTPLQYSGSGDRAGAHTVEVLEELGYTKDDINGFDRAGAFS